MTAAFATFTALLWMFGTARVQGADLVKQLLAAVLEKPLLALLRLVRQHEKAEAVADLKQALMEEGF